MKLYSKRNPYQSFFACWILQIKEMMVQQMPNNKILYDDNTDDTENKLIQYDKEIVC